MFGVYKKPLIGDDIRLKIDNEFYEEYIKKFGKESVKNYYKHFTYHQQIKRYEENIIFCIERIPKQTEEIKKASDLIVSMKGGNKTKTLSFSSKDDTETYARWEISTGKLRTLIKK
jgi:hypothetical protein